MMREAKVLCSAILLALLQSSVPARSEPFRRLDVLASHNGVLAITMIAEPRLAAIGGYRVDANLYTICHGQGLTEAQIANCRIHQANPYGGSLLRLKPGDHLKITLINRLPPAQGSVPQPVTNLHTHGLLVRARGTAQEDRLPGEPENAPYGDFVFVLASPEGAPATPAWETHATMNHGAHPVVGSRLDYDIAIPIDHPRGIYWFHPHPHGLSKVQVSNGMAGMIEIGSIDDYVCLTPNADRTCPPDAPKPTSAPGLTIREIVLKDAQLMQTDDAAAPPKAMLLGDQDAGFCSGNAGEVHTRGYCTGTADFAGGKWVFSMNGVSNPHWTVEPGKSEIWRIQNASANVTYSLCLTGDAWPSMIRPQVPAETCEHALPFQVLSLDGVAFGSAAGTPGSFVDPINLQRHVLLMPGSRIELLVAWRDPAHCAAIDDPTKCPAAEPRENQTIALQNLSFATGGDDWPRVRLATVVFEKSESAGRGTVATVQAMNRQFAMRAAIAAETRAKGAADLCRTGLTHRLAVGEKRRIYFAIADDNGEKFLLGSTILDKDGNERDEAGNPVIDPVLRPFDASTDKSDLCVPTGTEETWQLVNISPEVHNFHIHQNKFQIAPCSAVGCTAGGPAIHTLEAVDQVNVVQTLIESGASPNRSFPLHDTIIVPRGLQGACEAASIGTGSGSFLRRTAIFDDNHPSYSYVRTEGCKIDPADKASPAGWIEVTIPFTRAESVGKYVFHCHILEHEDKGMMASIRVLTSDQLAASLGQPH